MYKITKLYKKVPIADWLNYFSKYFKDIQNARKINQNMEMFTNDYPNVINNFTFGFNKKGKKKIQYRWYRSKCHRIWFSLHNVIKYCCNKYKNGLYISRYQAKLIQLLCVEKSNFDVRLCKSIKFNPGNDDGTLCAHDMAYGFDGTNWWFMYTLQV